MSAPADFTRRARAITQAAFRLLIVLWILGYVVAVLFPTIYGAFVSGYLLNFAAAGVSLAQHTLAIFLLWILHPRIVNWIWPLPRPGCPDCGYPLVPNAKVCPECGKPLPA